MDVISGIRVRINGEDREIQSGLTVSGLLESLDHRPSLVVVELHREFLDRGSYVDTPVVVGDILELVHFVGGG